MNSLKECDIICGVKAFDIEVSDHGDGSKEATIYSVIPDGLSVVDHHVYEGKKIIARKNFRKGDLLYTGHAALLDLSNSKSTFKLRLYSKKSENDSNNETKEINALVKEYENSTTHSVLESELGHKRQIYGFDAFMNHSCEPNSIHPLLSRSMNEMSYKAIALRDIAIGEEVTCDYALFDYTCDGHEIELCLCGSTNCRGNMVGFKGLTIEEKVDILAFVEEDIKNKFFEDENITVITSTLPQGIAIMKGSKEHYLVASKEFEAGDIVFTNQALCLPKDDFVTKTFLIEIGGHYFLLASDHFIHRDDYVEMVGFDSFMDHSCSPNTSMTYTKKDVYQMKALKPIQPGEKITCDYTQMESLGIPTSGKESFTCSCGQSNCYGTIVS